MVESLVLVVVVVKVLLADSFSKSIKYNCGTDDDDDGDDDRVVEE